VLAHIEIEEYIQNVLSGIEGLNVFLGQKMSIEKLKSKGLLPSALVVSNNENINLSGGVGYHTIFIDVWIMGKDRAGTRDMANKVIDKIVTEAKSFDVVVDNRTHLVEGMGFEVLYPGVGVIDIQTIGIRYKLNYYEQI